MLQSMGSQRVGYDSVTEQQQYNILLLSRFSRVRLCATPQTAAHQAPPSLGFSRQEDWSGLPFPSPMYVSEKWSCSVMSDSLQPRGLYPTRLLCPWDFPGKSTGVGCHCLLIFAKDFPGGSDGKAFVYNAGDLGSMAIHSSTIAWKIPWTEEPGRLQSMGSHRVGHD